MLGVEPLRMHPVDWVHAAYLGSLASLLLLLCLHSHLLVRVSKPSYSADFPRELSGSLRWSSHAHPTLRWCYQQSPQLLIGVFALAALMDPCLLSSVWLAMYCFAILVPVRIHVHVLPWLLAYAWVCLGIFFAAAVRFMPYTDGAGTRHDFDHRRGFLHLLGFKRWDPPFPLLLTQASVGLAIATFTRLLSSLNDDEDGSTDVSPHPPITLGFASFEGADREPENASWWTRAKVLRFHSMAPEPLFLHPGPTPPNLACRIVAFCPSLCRFGRLRAPFHPFPPSQSPASRRLRSA
eukprot:TRINITY_DN962_c0_g1_i3.p1 TRINITY_DN962_c0_g1~~TRINITY_DN962_c0_g1_i3.p1  ORF type:complete len:294 (-),score=44.28 TRINITY_DN962_c0_g1_i3:58-939(-)